MLQGQDIICFSNDWDSDPLSKKHIMTRLARRNRVLWVNSIGNRNPTVSAHDFRRAARKLREFAAGCKQVADNLHVLAPIAVPFHGNPLARWANRKILTTNVRIAAKRLGFSNPVTWSFLPSSADVVGTLGESLIVYHCVDEFSEFTGTDKEAILQMERRLIRKADVQIVSSSLLYATKSPYNRNTFLVTHGVDVEHFRQACNPKTRVPHDIGRLSRPVIGFFGLIADWVDLQLIRAAALARPGWSFVLIGKVATDAGPLRGLPNIHLTGRRSYEDLPAYCRAMDICLLPFVVNELTLAANPLKLREYLAAGLPVISTPIPEAEKFGDLIGFAATPGEFIEQIEAILDSGQSGPQMSRSLAMDTESWDQKVEELSDIVAEAQATARRPHARTAELESVTQELPQ